MITKDDQLEIEEQESGTYVFPNSKLYAPTWALYVYKDGRAELYKERNIDTGGLLGKPIDLGRRIQKIHPLDFMKFIEKATKHLRVFVKKTTKSRKEFCALYEVNGELYYQTPQVPAKNKSIK